MLRYWTRLASFFFRVIKYIHWLAETLWNRQMIYFFVKSSNFQNCDCNFRQKLKWFVVNMKKCIDGQVRLGHLQTVNLRWFLRQQTDKRQTSIWQDQMLNGLRKIAWASVFHLKQQHISPLFVFIYMYIHSTHTHTHIYIHMYIRKTEPINGSLFFPWSAINGVSYGNSFISI